MADSKETKLFDLHSHWGTKKGYPLRTEAELAQQVKTWKSPVQYATEEGMAEYFRKNRVRTILDFGFTKNLPIAEAREYHDYALETQRRFPDVIFGHWLQIDPRTGEAGLAEFKRCIQAKVGFIGLAIAGASAGFAASDSIYDPFYTFCLKEKVPVLILVGYTGLGAGIRGGKGVKLELAHPRYLDEVAIRFPDLDIIAGRSAWPWQEEMIAVLLHKPNIWYELHGWSPKYLTDSLKKEISRRLQDRVMFGADYPLFKYERLVTDWESLGYSREILEKLFYKNAESFFARFNF
jgi:predicted TIM-barrel fold metal-dependent hydrolase